MELHWILIGIGVLVVVALVVDWLLRKRSPGTISTGLPQDERGSKQRESTNEVLGPARVARREPVVGSAAPTLMEPVTGEAARRIEQVDLFADLEIPAAQPAPAREMRDRGEAPRRDRGEDPAAKGARGRADKGAEKPKRATPEEVIVVHVVATSGARLDGKALLQAALHSGLRYGDYRIFHRFETTAHDAPAQFSMANAVEPGVFDLEAMESQSYVGVSFFLMLPGPSNSRAALDAMIEAARRIANETGGELRDQHHSVLTAQTVEHLRQRVNEYERRRLVPRPE